MTILIAILALGLLILIHEAGHFAVARLCGMKVDVFSVGFGPALFSYEGQKTEYRLSTIPLGGYVRIAGMAPGDGTPEDLPESFANRPAWQRFLVIFAGPSVNWLFAVALLTGLYATGVPVPSREALVGEVVPASAAAVAGLARGDRILEIGGEPVGSWDAMAAAIRARKGKSTTLRVGRGGAELAVDAQVSPEGMLGVRRAEAVEVYSLGESARLAVVKSWEVTRESIVAVGQLFRGKGEAELMGPVGIVSQTAEAVRTSLLSLFAIMVRISLALSLMNLIPLPALDGGRLLFILYAVVRRRPVDARVEGVVHALGFVFLIGLIAWATVGDIGRESGRVHAGAGTDAGAAAARP